MPATGAVPTVSVTWTGCAVRMVCVAATPKAMSITCATPIMYAMSQAGCSASEVWARGRPSPGRPLTGGDVLRGALRSRSCYGSRPLTHVRSSRAIAFVASATFASTSSPPLTAASATQWRRCSSSSWRAKDCRALVEAETWVSMSMQ